MTTQPQERVTPKNPSIITKDMAEDLLQRYPSNFRYTKIDFSWKQSIEKVIKLGLFSEYISANTEANQVVIVLLARAGFKVSVEKIGCSVVRITIDNKKAV